MGTTYSDRRLTGCELWHTERSLEQQSTNLIVWKQNPTVRAARTKVAKSGLKTPVWTLEGTQRQMSRAV